MKYEWDEGKRQRTIRDRSLDFADACLVYEHPEKLTIDGQKERECRKMDIAEIGGVTLSLVYMMRNETIRVISFRRASRKERRYYNGHSNDS